MSLCTICRLKPKARFIGAVSISLLFLSPQLGRAADPPPNPEKSTQLQEIIQAVRDSEQLFKNFDLEYEQNYVLKRTDGYEGSSIDLVRHSTSRHHQVRQGDWWFLDQDKQASTFKNPVSSENIKIGYDGEVDRNVHQYTRGSDEAHLTKGGSAHIVTERHPVWLGELTPQKMGYDHTTPNLSQFLDGSAVTEKGMSLHVRVDGEESVNGLQCMRITYVGERGGSKPKARGVIWLAKERQYLPVREAYYNVADQKFPESIIETDDWREVEPGIWMPFHSTNTYYGSDRHPSDKPQNVTETRILKASLRPNYPRRFFQDISIPDGMVVYVQKGTKIVSQYIQGGPGSPSARWSRTWLIVFSLVAALIAALGVYGAWRWKSRGTGVLPASCRAGSAPRRAAKQLAPR